MAPTEVSPVAEPLDGRVRRLDPRAQTAWMILRALLVVVPWLIVVVLFAANGNGDLVVILSLLAVFGVVATSGSAMLSYRAWSWSAHDDALEISRGVVYRHTSVVPYRRIQQIDIERDPLERILGIATLVLRSAAATTDAKLPGIALAHSEELRHALLARAGVDDAV